VKVLLDTHGWISCRQTSMVPLLRHPDLGGFRLISGAAAGPAKHTNFKLVSN
jgi:hypothetical protein